MCLWYFSSSPFEFYLIQWNLVIRNFLVISKLFTNTNCSLSSISAILKYHISINCIQNSAQDPKNMSLFSWKSYLIKNQEHSFLFAKNLWFQKVFIKCKYHQFRGVSFWCKIPKFVKKISKVPFFC